jgi:regulator of sigma E protease
MRGVRFFFGVAVENGDAVTPFRCVAVVLASLAASYLLAGVLFAVALQSAGRTVWGTEIGVVPGKPAETAGMRTGDRLVVVAGQPVNTWEELSSAVAAHAEESIEIVGQRDDGEIRFTVTPRGPQGHGKIGVRPSGQARREPAGVGHILHAAFAQPGLVLIETARAFSRYLSPEPAPELQGPAKILKEAKAVGWPSFAETLWYGATLVAYCWPLTALTAIALVPRRRRCKSTDARP